MRVLVTGGAGFIGSHIVDQLIAAGHEPAVIDDLSSGVRGNLPDPVPLYEVDVRDAEGVTRVFEEVRPQWVCHQAAQMSVSRSVREPRFDAEVNLIGLLNVLENAVRAGAERVVFASSGGVLYGDVSQPAGEDHPAAPVSPYGISKWGGEQYLQFYAREHGLRAVALRYSNVYGPRQNPHGEAGVVAIFSRAMLAGRAATINGDGRYLRDYVYAADVARANVLSLEAEFAEPFIPLNVGTGQGTDVNELAESLRALAQSHRPSGEVPAPEHGPARPGDLRSSLVSAERARTLLGWEPRISLPDGLRETVGWFAAQGSRETASH
ncbi:MAG: NAD-dependent epimerase/dehydratase family protein [Planctomycetaceae bacterium]